MGEIPLVENDELPLAKPTLSTFSLAGRVCVVTGGAQGLVLNTDSDLMAKMYIVLNC